MKQIDQQKILRTMIELAHDGILLLDPHGIIIQANPAALSICGFKSMDDIRPPIKFTDLFDLYDLNHIEAPMERHPISRALNGESIIDFKCKGIRKDTGKEGFWLFSASPMFDETKSITAVVLSIKEIFFLFGSEKTLLQSEEQLRLAFSAGNIGFYDFDIPSGKAKVNPEYETILEYTPGEIQNITLDWWTNSIHPDDRRQVRSILDDCISGKSQDYKMDFRMQTKSGGWKWILCRGKIVKYDKQGKPIRMFGTHTDITERKHVEESLRESERKAHAIMDISFGFLGFLNPEGIVLDANKTALEFIGVDLVDVKGKPFRETPWWRHSKETQKQIQDAITAATQGKLVRMETTHAAKDGAIHFIDFSLKPMFDENHRVVLLIAEGRDITERKQTEIKLTERNRFIESIVNMSPNILFIYDLVDNKNIYINNSIEKILGYTRDEILTMGSNLISSLMHPDDLVQYQQAIIPRYAIAKDNEPIIHEFRMKHKSGEWRRLTSNETIYLRRPDGSPRQIFGLVQDITESKAAEEALRESEYFFKESQSAANIGSYKLDLTTGYWKSSEVLDRIFGIGPDYNRSIQGWLDIIHPDDHAMMDKYFREEVVSKHQPFRKEYRIIRKSDGIVRWVDGSGRIAFDNRGVLISMFGTIQDITERKLAEEALREERDKLTTIAATVPVVILSFKLRPDGLFQLPYASPAYLDVLGFSPEEMAKDLSPVIKHIHPDDRESITEAVAESSRTLSPLHKEFRYNHPIKGEVWIEGHTVPRREADGGTIWHGFVNDITTRKLAQEALRLSEEKFSKAFMNSPDSITISRLDNGVFFEINNGSMEIFGHSRDEMIGHSSLPNDLHIWVNREDRDRVVESLKIKGEINAFESLFRRKDGSILYGIMSARIIKMNGIDYMLATIHDVTERKRAEEALRQSEEKFSRAFMISPDALAISQISDGVFIEVNSGMEMLGYSREEMIGHSPLPGDLNIWINKDDRNRMLQILKTGGEVKAFEILFRCKDGRIRTGMLSARIIKMNEEDYVLTITRDITEQKQAQEALRQSEEKFSRAFMISPDALAITRISDGVFTEINNGSMEIFGYSREEMIGHSSLPGDLNLWTNKDDRDRMMTILKTGGEVKAFEMHFRCKDGRIRNGMLSARTIKMNEEDYVLTITRDITEQKQAEEALRQSEEKFSKAFMTSPDSITITGLSDGVLIELNNGCMRIFGYTREEMIGHSVVPGDLSIWVNGEDRDRLVADLSAKGEVNKFETLLRRKDRSILYAIISAGIIKIKGKDYLLSTIRDITEQKQAEEALRQSEEKFSKAFMTSPDSISISSIDDGVFIETNDGSVKIFGYSREEMIGHSSFPGDLNIWVNKEDRDRLVESLTTKGEIYGLETLLRRKDGSIIDVIFSARTIKMNGIDYILSTTRDITEQKRAQEALRQSEEKFSKAFMTSPDSITITRLTNGVFLEINNGNLEMFGYTREEMIGQTTLAMWVNKEDRDRMIAILRTEGKVTGFEAPLRHKNGTILIGIISARIIKIKGIDYILSIIRDITEQKRAKEVQDRLTRELRALSSCNQALIRAENEQTLLDEICRIVYEIAGYRLAWVGLLVNEEAPYIRVVSQAGSGETIIANETYALTDKEETPIDTAVRSRKSSITLDFANAPEESLWSNYALKNGCRSAIALPLLDDAGNSMGVLSIYSGEPNVFAAEEIKLLEELAGDLSFGIVSLRTRVERKLAQRALVYEKELSDALIEASPGIFLVMDHTGRILRMNSNFMKLQGLTRENYTSGEIFKFIYKDDYESSKKDLERLSHVGHAEADARFEFKPGEISWWSMSGHAVTIAGTVYMIVTGSDITLRKHTEENLQKALKEKDVLLQELYHRTKNNMQVISSYLAMQAVILDDEKLQPIFNEMENRIRAMALVHEKLYKSKDLTNINLNDYLGDLSKLLFAGFPGASDKVNLVYEIENIFVTIDIAVPIGLVVTELITNSLKYAFPDGRSGKIYMEVRKHDHGELELNISDNGVGAPKDFDLKQKGSLGIPTVLSIVQKQLRGSVELDTEGGFKWEIIFRSDLYSKRV